MGRPKEPTGGRRLVDVVTSPARRSELVATGEWTEQTLVGEVSRHAVGTPGAIAVIDRDGERMRTYAELDADANRVANTLIAMGVQPGDVVSVQLPNWYDSVAVDIGVLKAGAVLNPLLPIYRTHELANVIATAGTRVLITPRAYRNYDHVAMAEEVISGAPVDVRHLVVDDEDDEILPWATAASSAPDVQVRADDVSELIFSSGTEAQPKAIMHTEQTTNSSVRNVIEALRITGEDRVWMPSPIGHSTGFNFGLRLALLHGLPLALQDRWDPGKALDLVRLSGASYTVAATTFLSDLLDVLDERQEYLPSLRLFGCGGAPIPAAQVERAERHGVAVLRLYGATEVLIGSWCRPSDPADKRLHTDGRPLPGVELQIRTQGDVARPGVSGELYVRSPATSVGFFNDPVRTFSTFDEQGWVKTGDIGTLDETGFFTMLGRSKEILIRGGLNVAPAEIEELIMSMPGVKEVAVVALPDDRLGEIGCACIVPEPGFSPDVDAVVAHLRAAGLASFKLPEAVHLLAQLPKTPTGKVQKFEIVRHIAAGGDMVRRSAQPQGSK